MKGLGLAVLLAVGVSACDAGPSAVPPTTGATPPTVSAGPVQLSPNAPTVSVDPRDAPVPLVGGKPMWSANRRNTAQENARSHFERDGADFGARSVDDFVAKAHAFIDKPPKGVLTITRPNGDRLLYDPKTNVFAVATRAGAPRTMFKPRKGMAYWEDQVRKEAAGAKNGGA